jgi:hypothetical protein
MIILLAALLFFGLDTVSPFTHQVLAMRKELSTVVQDPVRRQQAHTLVDDLVLRSKGADHLEAKMVKELKKLATNRATSAAEFEALLVRRRAELHRERAQALADFLELRAVLTREEWAQLFPPAAAKSSP